MILSTAMAAFSIAGLTMLHSSSITKTEIPDKYSQIQSVQTIQTPKKADKPVKITVKRGDSLSKIAKKQKTEWRRIFDANKNIKDPDVIKPGDKLRIPKKDEKLKHRPLPAQRSVAPKKAVYVPKSAPAAHTAPVASHVSYPAVSGGSVWDRLAQCESGGNWSINTGNGYYGGLQFTLSTWRSLGGSGYPNQASRSEQIARAQALQARSGWGQWPACAAKLGLL
ncbi:MAG TPA: transglycosylase family protein [Candidatus Saccharimonadales bacterium]|nr:transglycosylase family protein [Candidatus Saccharimonadales bacterium]